MREIKFRAWDGKVMRQNVVLVDGNAFKNEVRAGKPMQYTGLKDRNGVEIYESDIIHYDNERYEVYWSEDWAMFTVKGCQVQALMRYASYGEVVGNVYEA
ncbi:YopX family protein [Paenibacillus prosopidis]|uniref:YopX protein n=1 Tax=Paenibacillus prosopidis TaxID=630520 RepID=A0A368VRA5_9BACL|nr:YopX family protein [Paenibacillus prosopidis]RCW44239.1 YopX protein [Paenibacillus prosopidis]